MLPHLLIHCIFPINLNDFDLPGPTVPALLDHGPVALGDLLKYLVVVLNGPLFDRFPSLLIITLIRLEFLKN